MRNLKIKELNVEGFGKFHDFKIEFHDGINLVVGPNESGKTTLYKFIVSALSELSQEDFHRYKPWNFDKFGGSVSLIDPDRELKLQDNPIVDRKYLESLCLLSDEDDNVEFLKVDEVVVAKLRNKMSELEEAEKINFLLKKIPLFEERLLAALKNIDEQIKSIESAIHELRKRRESLFTAYANRLYLEERLENLKETERYIRNQIKEIQDQINKEIERIKKEAEENLRSLRIKLEREKSLPVISLEEYNHVIKLNERLESYEQKLQELQSLLEKLSSQRTEIQEQLDRIKKDLVWEDDLEKIKLRIKNIELRYNLLESKADQLKDYSNEYQSMWENFENEGDKVLRLVESEFPTSVELEIKQINNKLKFIEEEVLKRKSRTKLLRTLSILMAFSAVSLFVFGFLMSSFWFYPSATLAAGSVIAFFLLFRSIRKLEDDDEQKLKLQLELRSIEKRRNSAVQRILKAFNVESIEALKEAYQKYQSWRSEKDQMEKLRQKISEDQKEVVSELEIFGAKDINDVPSILIRLNELIKVWEKNQVVLANLQQSIEKVRSDIESVANQISGIRLELESSIGRIGLQDLGELEDAFKRNYTIDELEKKMNYLTRMIGYLKDGNIAPLLADEPSLADLVNRKEELEDNLERLSNEMEYIIKELSKVNLQVSNLFHPEQIVGLLHDLSVKNIEKNAYSRQRIQLAKIRHVLERELDILTGSYADKFSKLLCDLFSRFSELAQDLYVEKDLSIKLFVKSSFMEVTRSLSRASQDQLAFCYKLALYETLQPAENLPLIIDNFPIRFDKIRLRTAIDILKEKSQNRQIILFTSDVRIPEFFGIEPVLELSS
ncbi:ATP-binding protein [Pseudothermotoga lettingae]|uniref:Endonuclease GajA/Old nuclease/RecF-like AAA domain-containing protein n=1 Tax=Pseudothermotoga lettingae (strain ATCC BAA-301 / DSM 14385 / NBRC 107922 / TMO) TaxID=416591 RepID=A8F5L4_PSELT|nr:AAA family ATPase [Pseudothermotoga lettingae]ABV33448.1 hypothetical protein Tlet_0882 [Pseudothermotoga lettingae TMO]GLI49638.1 hypothetical protein PLETTINGATMO_18070 [Pseudothermotoga lettingae TMO]